MTPEQPHERWASYQIRQLWTREQTTLRMRQIWLELLKVHIARKLITVENPDQVIGDYNRAMVVLDTDLETIDQFEYQTGHHLQAQLQAFETKAGNHWLLHRGLTSCDITDLVTQWQTLDSLHIIKQHWAAVTQKLCDLAQDRTAIVGRTHGQPAQATTVGRRFAIWLDQMLCAYRRFAHLQDNYQMRVLGGAVGNRADLASAYHRSAVDAMVDAVTGLLDNSSIYRGDAHGQTYHRILDLDVASVCTLLTAPLTNMAATLRAMTALGQVSERRTEQQVGSSAMPHKTNPRFLERITALHRLSRGYLATLADTSTDQWFEGDVADSAARRVAIPGVLMATDGILGSAAVALGRLRIHRDPLEDEWDQNRPFLATGQLVQAAVDAAEQIGLQFTRADAHRLIRQHAGLADDDGWAMLRSLAVDAHFPMDMEQIVEIVNDTSGLLGEADSQADRVVSRALGWLASYDQQTLNWTPDGVL